MPRGGGKRYNELKREILSLLSERDMTAEEIVGEIEVEGKNPINVVSSRMQSYMRYGLVEGERSAEDGRKFLYSITKKGRDRVSRLRREEEEE